MIATMLVGAALSSAALAEPACYDTKVRAVPVDQVPSDIGDCGGDCILISWPWFVDLQVKRVIDGALSGKRVRVLTVQHTYHVSREGSWWLRKNTEGGYNVVVPEDGVALTRCSAAITAVEPYIRPGDGQSLDDLRNEGIRRYGHHRTD